MGEAPKTCTKGSPCKKAFKKVTHVIFDVDGTLLNTEVAYTRAIKETSASYGKNYTHDLQMRHLGRSSQMMANIVVEELEIPAGTDEFLRKYHIIAHSLIGESELMPGVEDLVRHLHKHNIPLAIATSSVQEGFDIKMSNHQDFLKLFSHYVLTEDPEVKQGKPSPDIFLVACKRFKDKPKPEECLVFEDSPSGVKAAIAAGMQCVMVPDKDIPNELKKDATLVLNGFDEFKPEVFGLPPMD